MSSPSASPQYVVRDLFPVNEIHLIFGPAHSGKTTLMLQILEDWRNGRDVFGCHSHVQPFCLIACERPESALRAHMRRLGMDPSLIPHFSLIDQASSGDDYNFETLVATLRKRCPEAKVLFIDGLSTLCPGRSYDQRDVSKFLLTINQFCKQQSITIIACLYAVKAKEGAGYAAPLDRLSGSGVWSSMTGCKLLIDPIDPKDPTNPNRLLLLFIRSRAPRATYAKYVESGLLSYADTLELTGLDSWLAQLEPGKVIRTSTIHETAQSLQVSRSSVFRWIENQITLCTLSKIRKGTYIVPPRASA
jgi:hypothetical protein